MDNFDVIAIFDSTNGCNCLICVLHVTLLNILDRRKYQCVESKGICIVLHPSEGMVTGGMDVRKEHETGSSSRRSGALARPQGQRRKPSLFVVLLSI